MFYSLQVQVHFYMFSSGSCPEQPRPSNVDFLASLKRMVRRHSDNTSDGFCWFSADLSFVFKLHGVLPALEPLILSPSHIMLKHWALQLSVSLHKVNHGDIADYIRSKQLGNAEHTVRAALLQRNTFCPLSAFYARTVSLKAENHTLVIILYLFIFYLAAVQHFGKCFLAECLLGVKYLSCFYRLNVKL